MFGIGISNALLNELRRFNENYENVNKIKKKGALLYGLLWCGVDGSRKMHYEITSMCMDKELVIREFEFLKKQNPDNHYVFVKILADE